MTLPPSDIQSSSAESVTEAAPKAPKPISPLLQRSMQRNPSTYGLFRQLYFRFARRCTIIAADLNYRVKITGKEHVPNTPDFIAVANHVSNWDPPMVGRVLVKYCVAFMAKRELFETHPALSWAMENLGCIAIDRDNVGVTSIKSAKAIAGKTNWVVGLFPEGTRQKGPLTEAEADADASAKRGAAFLARSIGQPVLPMAINYGTEKRGWLFKRKDVHITIGPLIPVNKKADMDELTQQIMKAVRELQHQAEQGR